MTKDEYEAQRRRLEADAEDARKAFVRAKATYDGICDELRLLRVNWTAQQCEEAQSVRVEAKSARRFGVRFDPAGCAVGSTYAGQFDTTDKVHKEFTAKAADRRRESAEGWRHEVLTHDAWKQRAEPCLTGKCEHEVAGRGE